MTGHNSKKKSRLVQEGVKWATLFALLFLLPCICAAFNGGDPVWTSLPNNAFRDQQAGKQEPIASVMDNVGNTIITGYQTLPNSTLKECYTIKVSPSGVLQWRRSYVYKDGLNNSYDTSGTALTVDSAGNVYVTGMISFTGSSSTAFTLRYDSTPSGSEPAWINTVSNDGAERSLATSIAVDSTNGFVYVTGSEYYSSADGNKERFMVLKYQTAASGNNPPVWQIPNASIVTPGVIQSIAVDPAKNGGMIAVAGQWRQDGTHKYFQIEQYDLSGARVGTPWNYSLSSDGSGLYVAIDSKGHIVATGNSGKDIYTVKYCTSSSNPCSNAGVALWEQTYTNSDAIPKGMYIDKNNDNVFITAKILDADLKYKFYTAGYKSNLQGLLWTGGGVVYSSGKQDIPTGIVGSSLGGDDYLFVTGSSVDPATNAERFRTIKYRKSTGDQLWSSEFHDSGYDKYAKALGIALHPTDGQVFVAGFVNQSDQDDYDYYVVKYEKGIFEAPVNLYATIDPADATKINLSWQDNNTSTPNFHVERCATASDHLLDCDFTNPIVIKEGAVSTSVVGGKTIASFTDTGLTADKYYYYRVMAYTSPTFDSATASHPTNVAHAVTQSLLVNAITSDHTYKYNGVANSEDYALSIASGPNGNPVVTGRSIINHNGRDSLDFYTIKFDRAFNLNDTLHNPAGIQSYNGEDDADEAKCVAVDSNNQVVVSGYSYANFGLGDMDTIYTIKYNPAFNLESWHASYSGPDANVGPGMAVATTVDSGNNVIVAAQGTKTVPSAHQVIYLLHYPSAGPGASFWARTIDNGYGDQPTAVAIDSQDNVIVTGITTNALGETDIITSKYDKNGTLVTGWPKVYDGGNGNDAANDVTVDAQGNIYVVGFTTIDAQGHSAFITIKYDSNGNMQWGGPKTYPGPFAGDNEAISVKYDRIDKRIVVAGNQLTDAGNHDIHIIRYNTADGSEKWYKTLLKEGTDEDMAEMAMDSSGNVYITATTTDSSGNQDILTFKIDYSGNITGNGTSYGAVSTTDRPYSLAANYLGEVYVAGITQLSGNADYIVLKIDGDSLQSPTLTSTSATYTTSTLNWTNNSRQTNGIQVARQPGACPSYDYDWNGVTPTDLGAGTITWGETGLTQNTSYCYGVRAKNGATYSRWVSTTVTTATPPMPDISRLNSNQSAETGYGAVATGTTSVSVTWGIPAYSPVPTGFTVDRCSAGISCLSNFVSDGNPFPVSVSGASANNYIDSTACPGISYYYRVAAANTTAGASWSSAFSATTWVTLPTVDNPVVDGDFEGNDLAMTWWGRVGSNPPYFFGGVVAADGSHPKALTISIDNSAVTGAGSIWKNILAAPTAISTNLSATVSGSTVGDGSLFPGFSDGSGWKSRKLISPTSPTALAANTLYAIAIPRNGTITDGSEPQVNFQDVRFYDSIGQAELPCLLVSGTTASTTFWFKTPANVNGIYVYYGNANAGPGSNMTIAKQLVGRRQPVLTRAGGRYNIAAAMKANLSIGALWVNLNNQAVLSATQTGIDHNLTGFNNAFNNDNAWHIIDMDVISTLSGTNYLRAFINRSSGDTNVPQYFPQGSGSVDDIVVKPLYNLTASTISEKQINLTWAASAYDETGYKVERCITTDGSTCNPAGFTYVILATPGISTYSDTGLTPGSTYSYRIYPYKTSSNSCGSTPGWSGGWSGTASNTATATATLMAPSSLTATAPNTTQVNLSWVDNTSSETGLQLERCLASSCSYSAVTTYPLAANTTSFIDTGAGVCNNTTYNYRIKAINSGKLSSDGGSTWGNKATLNFGSSFVPNFMTKMTLTAGQLGGSDATAFNSLRFLDSTASQELPYWIPSITGSGASTTATVWFKSGANNSIDIYYNNSSAGSTGNAAWLFPGLAGYWPFDETPTSSDGATIADLSGLGNNLTLKTGNASYGIVNPAATTNPNTSLVVGSKYGNALWSDGSGNGYSYLQKAPGTITGLPIGSVMSAEAWVYPTWTPASSAPPTGPPYDYNGIVSWGNRDCLSHSISLSMTPLGGPQVPTWCNDYSTNVVPLTFNAWNHYVFTLNGRDISVYVNGVRMGGTFDVTKAVPVIASQDLFIGALDGWITAGDLVTTHSGRYFKGMIDEVKIYNKVLTAQDVAARYAASLPVVASLINVQSNPVQPSISTGWTETAYSTPTSVTTPAKPAAPTVPAASTQNEYQINVTWTFTTTDQTGFHIDRCTDAACASVQTIIDVPDASLRAYLDSGLNYNTQYWYRIRAYKNASCPWETTNSSIVTATTKSMTTAKPTVLAGSNPLAAVVANCDDIRVTRLESDGTTETLLPIYIQNKNGGNAVCGQNATSVIVKTDLPVGASNTYYLYYGSPNAPATSDGNKVFTFFDDFDGNALNTAKWDTANSNLTGFSVANNSSNLTGINTSGRLLSVAKFPPVGEAAPASSSQYYGYTLQARAKVTTLPTNGYIPAGFYNSPTDNVGFRVGTSPVNINADPPQIFSIDNSVSTQTLLPKLTGSSSANNMIYQIRPRRSSVSSDMYLAMTDLDVLTSGATTAYWTPGTLATHSVTSAPIVLGRRYDDNNGTSYMNETYSATWDWLRVRKYASPAPVVGTLGSAVSGTFSVNGVSGWKYQQPFTITNSDPNALNLTGYEVNLPAFDTSTASVFPVTGHITLTWTDNTISEDGFYIYRCSGAACTPSATPFATVGPLFGTGATATYTDGATVSNTIYCYQVAAYKGNPASPTWTTDLATKYCSPATYNQQIPTNLAGTPSGSQVTLVWDDKTIGETGYKLERCDTAGCDFSSGVTTTLIPAVSNIKNDGVTVVAPVLAASSDPPHASFIDSTVGCSGTFRYRISAYFQNDPNNLIGPSVATGDVVVGAAPTAPTLSGTATYPNEQQIKLTWTDANATGVWNSFIIERCTATGGSCSNGFMQVGTITGTRTLNYTDPTIVPGVQYGYRVTTTISSACGIVTSPASTTTYGTSVVNSLTAGDIYPVPVRTPNVSLTDVASTKLRITPRTATEQSFTLKRCAGLNCTDFNFLSTLSPINSSGSGFYYTDTTTCPGIVYTYSLSPAEYPKGMPILSNNGGLYWKSSSLLSFSAFAANGIASLTLTRNPAIVDGSEPKADFSDIRIYDSVAKAELAHGFTISGNTATIRFQANSNAAGIYLMYGNASANSNNKTSLAAANMTGNTTTVGAKVNPAAISPFLSNDKSANYLWMSSLPLYFSSFTPGGVAQVTIPRNPAITDGSEPKADYSDIRFYDSVAMTELQYSIQSGYTATSATVWLKVGPNATSNQIYLYYGNVNANSSVNSIATGSWTYGAPNMAGNNTTLGTQVKAPTNTTTAVIPWLYNIITDWNFNLYTWTQWGSGTVNSDQSLRFADYYTYYVTLASSGTGGYKLSSVPVIPGAQYQLKAYIKTALTAGTAKCDVTNAAAGFTSTVTNVKVTGTQGWTELPVDTINIPANVSTVDLRCYIDTGVGTAYFGAAQLLATGNPLVLSANAFDESTIDVSWNDFFGATYVGSNFISYGLSATGYNIYSCTDGSGASCALLPSPAAPYLVSNGIGASYRISGLTPGATYYYKVAAYKSGSQTCSGNGNDPANSIAWRVNSNVASATTTNGKPAAPTVTPVSSTSMKLSWPDKASGETDYDIYRCDGGGACAYVYNQRVTSNHNADQSIKASYSLDGTGTPLTDRSTIARNLTISSGTPQYDDGGFILNSATLYRSNANDTNINNSAFTIEFDYKFSQNITSGQTIMYLYPSTTSSSEQLFYINTASTGSHRLDFISYDYVSYINVTILGNVGINGVNGNDFTPGRWYHFKIVRNIQNLSVYVDGTQVATSNSAPAPISAPAYTIYLGQNGNYLGTMKNLIYYNSVVDPSQVTYNDTTVCPGSSYQYKVTPYKAGWPQLGTSAGELVLSDASGSAVTPTIIPPTGFAAKTWSDASNRIDLSWAQPATTNGQSSFLVKECPGSNCASPFTISPATATSSSRIGLTPETSYCYQIASYAATTSCGAMIDNNGTSHNGSGVTSAYSTAVCAETAMNSPSGLGFQITGGTPTYSITTGTSKYPYKVHLKWTDNTAEESYYEVQALIRNNVWVNIGTVSPAAGTGNAIEFYDTIGIEPGKTYTYRVRAFRASDNTESPVSNSITVTTPGFNTVPDQSTCNPWPCPIVNGRQDCTGC